MSSYEFTMRDSGLISGILDMFPADDHQRIIRFDDRRILVTGHEFADSDRNRGLRHGRL